MLSIPTAAASAANHKPAADGPILSHAEIRSSNDARMVADFEILNPESLAHSLLQHDEICREDLCKLLHAAVSRLPESPGKLYSGLRKPGATADSLHYTCTQCPSVIRALNQYIAQLLPEASYNALVVLDNLKSPAHKDSLNATVPSWILPIGNFTAGFVWQEDPAASVIRTINGMPTAGALLDVASGAQCSSCPLQSITKRSRGKVTGLSYPCIPCSKPTLWTAPAGNSCCHLDSLCPS